MATESGDNKLIGNFRKLIDEVSAEAAYNPANNKLKTTALETQYTTGHGLSPRSGWLKIAQRFSAG